MLEIFVGVLAALLVRDALREWLRYRSGQIKFWDWALSAEQNKRSWKYRYYRKAQQILGDR